MGKRFTIEFVRKFIKENGNGDILISENYKNLDSLLEIECNSCKQHYFKTFDQFQSWSKHPNCPNAPKRKSKTKHSYEYVFSHIASKGGKLLSKTYIDNEQKLEIECRCGNIIYRPFASINASRRILCDDCQGKAQSQERRISLDEVKISLANKGYILLDNEYVSTNENINVENITTKYRYFAKRNQILKYKLLDFAPNNPHSEYNFKIWMIDNNIEDFSFINIFVKNKNTWANFRCNICNEEWDMLLHNIIRTGQKCPYCMNKRVGKTNNLLFQFPEICEDWDYSKNEFLPSNFVSGSNKKVWWKCHKCDYEWQATPNSRTGKTKAGCYYCSYKEGVALLFEKRFSSGDNLAQRKPDLLEEWDWGKNDEDPYRLSPCSKKKIFWICHKCKRPFVSSANSRSSRGTGCPFCKESRMEKKVSEILLKNKELFTPQKRFFDCRNINPLPFDFFLNNKNIIIETHGRQHYEIVNAFGGEKGFKMGKINDEIKEKYCKDNGINMIIIPYWEYNNIEIILNKILGFKEEGGKYNCQKENCLIQQMEIQTI